MRAPSKDQILLIAHLSDLHVRRFGDPAYGRSPTTELTQRAFAALSRLAPRPDLLLIGGDLTDDGRPEQYRELAAMIAELGLPVLAVPGNHDDRAAMLAELPLDARTDSAGGFVQFVADCGGVRFIGLDSLVPGSGEGALCAERLAFLDRALTGAGGREVAIVMHHPPVACGLDHVDRIRLIEGREALAERVARHGGPVRILCGHIHRPIVARFAGAIVQTAPSVVHQLRLDLLNTEPPGFVMEPPAFLLHAIGPEGLVTHMATVEDHDGPYPFRRPG